MNLNSAARKLGAVLLGFCFLGTAQAAWELNPQASELHFISVKKNDVAEVHRFDGLTGSIADNGAAVLEIDLATVKTGVDVRDQRMRDFLFETMKFPKAIASLQLDSVWLTNLQVGESRIAEWPLMLDLHGAAQSLTARLQVARLSEKQILVTTPAPMLVQATQFELTGGIGKLAELASLPMISAAVPVSVNLLFEDH